MSSKRLLARVGDEDVRVEILADGRVTVDSETAAFNVTRVGDGEYLVSEAEPICGATSHVPPSRPQPDSGVAAWPRRDPGEHRGAEADSPAPLQWRLWVAGPPDARSVHLDGDVIELEILPEGSRRRGARGGAESLAAPMPATVVEILVQAGQEVRQGDVLLKLEAMKMEMALRAAVDGRIAAIRCRPGELVQPGIPLVEME